jgi:hypothetical protein
MNDRSAGGTKEMVRIQNLTVIKGKGNWWGSLH